MPRGRKGQRRGIGFVELQSTKLAKAALLKHGMLLMGRRINVREARPDADAESLQEAKQGRLAVTRGAALHVRPPGCRAVFVGNLAWQDEDRLRRGKRLAWRKTQRWPEGTRHEEFRPS